jgi:hypothetical protein
MPIDVEDPAQIPESDRTRVIEASFSADELRQLQAEADHRGVTLEEYMRWRLLTAAASIEAGGTSAKGGGA